jgi:SAM-dependent methyltransferase
MAPHATKSRSYDNVWQDVYGDMQEIGPAHRHLRRQLRAVLAGLEFDSVLEVGCGAGHNFALLQGNGRAGRLTGIDVSEEALRRARARRPDAELHLVDVQHDRLEETWDLVFGSLVLEHLPDDVAALERMHSMTGRWLVLATIAGNFDRYRAWEEQVGHVRNYRRGELEAKVEGAGFEVDRATYWGFPFYSPIARTLQNRMRAEPSYGRSSRLLAWLMYGLYFLNSGRRGDLLILVARPRSRSSAAPAIDSSSERRGS